MRKRHLWSTEIDRHRVILGLVLITGCLVMVHVLAVALGELDWQLERAFHLDREGNVPTWFASLLWALAALAAYSCSRLSLRGDERRTWVIAALALLFLSCDEIASFHTHVGHILRVRVFSEWSFVETFNAATWPLTLGPIICLGLVLLGVPLYRCLRGSRRAGQLLVLGTALFLIGELGFELLGNFVFGDSMWFIRKVVTAMEETLGMAGSIMILSGLLLHYEVLESRQRVGA